MMNPNRYFVSVAGVALLAMSCSSRRQLPRHQSEDERGQVLRSLRPLAWLSDHNRLLVIQIDHMKSVSVGQVNCDSTGLFLFQEGQPPLRKTGPEFCNLLSELDDVSADGEGRFLVYSDVFQQGSIFRLNLTQLTNERMLTDCLPANSAPALSRDGSDLAFVASCNEPNERAFLHLGHADGSDVRPIPPTGGSLREDHPTWAPDGKEVALVRGAGASPDQIVVVDTRTGARKPVAHGRDPSWSPTGEWIAYIQLDSTQTYPLDLRLVNPQGGSDHVLYQFTDSSLRSPTKDFWLPTPPIWSPDGRQIAFGSRSSVWIMALNDSAPHALLFPSTPRQ